MKTPEFSLESLKKQKGRKKKKRYLNSENLNAHYLLKLPIFLLLAILFVLNAVVYLLIRFLIFLFENISLFLMTKCKNFTKSLGKTNDVELKRKSRKVYNNDKPHKKNLNGSNDVYKTNASILKTEQIMNQCNNYYDYLNYAYQMDFLTGKIIHINENYDYMNVHDVNLLHKTTESIQNNFKNKDILHLLEDIKIATSPQTKGIFQEKYYCKTYSTPHKIITNFINHIILGLDLVESYIKEKTETDQHFLSSDEYIIIKKYFEEIYNQWGNTALFLSGGAILGLHHFGVIDTLLKTSVHLNYINDFQKCRRTNDDYNINEQDEIDLWGNSRGIKNFINNKENNDKQKRNVKKEVEAAHIWEESLMPQIICGTSAGSIVAAWICSKTKEEFLNDYNTQRIYNIASCFSSSNSFYSFFNIFKKGNFYDVDKFIINIYNLYGDITFLEAFLKTNLVLNITVTRAESENDKFNCDEEGHIVLNYTNSPNILIYTAVLASCSFPYLLQPFKLLEKKYDNENFYHFMAIKSVCDASASASYRNTMEDLAKHIDTQKIENNIQYKKKRDTENIPIYEEEKQNWKFSEHAKTEKGRISGTDSMKLFIENVKYAMYNKREPKESNSILRLFRKEEEIEKSKTENIRNIDQTVSEQTECNSAVKQNADTTNLNDLLDHMDEQKNQEKNITEVINNDYNKMLHNEFINLLNEKYTIINSIQFKNMYFHDGSLKSDIPAHNLNQMFSVKYKIVSQVNPHVFPFIGLRIHGEAGKPVNWRGTYGHWRAGFLMSSMEILFKENMRYILRLMALLDLSPTVRGLNAGSIAMQNYNGDVTLHPRRLYMKHFKLISVSNYNDVEWYIQQGRQMTFQKLPLILNRMKIEKKLTKMKKQFF